jgi:hypothetical protein
MAFRFSVPRNVLNFQRRRSPLGRSSFREWKNVVESIVTFQTGKDVDDLPDENYYVMYTSGIPPQAMADLVLKKNP